MASTQLSKQDYLKKYLSGGDKKKKKKKKVTQASIVKSKIIDDDIDLKNMKAIDSDDLEIYDLAEEAPQIVGIIDDRPEEIRLMSEFKNKKKWKIVADEYGIEDVKVTAIGGEKKASEGKTRGESAMRRDADSPKKDSGASPPGKTRDDSDRSPPRRIKKEKSDSDASPPRKSKKDCDSDASPPRKPKKEYDSDASPPRKSKKDCDSDASPPRKSKKDCDSDASPPRKPKKEYDSDASPPRKSKKDCDSDASPPRKPKKEYDSDASPPRKSSKRYESDASPGHSRRSKTKSKKSKVKREKPSPRKRSRDDSSSQLPNEEAASKVAPVSKKSGLQNAEELRKEIEELKEREKEMKALATGKNEAVVVRDKKTGMRIDPKEEARKRREKEEKEAEKIAQYAVWGKGVKQVQDSQDKLKDDLYEMSKPLARYADDKDLDEMLKNKEWDGDPMLAYIQRKKRKTKKKEALDDRPQYEGSYMPNRYGIRPGHRWDGVDRSNGYEKKWFDEQNAKKAREEEAFKWSTADM